MLQKNLISQFVKRTNRFSILELPLELVELSEKDLKHIVGGCCCHHCCPPPPPPKCGCPQLTAVSTLTAGSRLTSDSELTAVFEGFRI